MIADLILTIDDYILSLVWVWVGFLDPKMNLENITWICAWIWLWTSHHYHHWSPGRRTRSLGVTRQNLVNESTMRCWLFDGWDKGFERNIWARNLHDSLVTVRYRINDPRPSSGDVESIVPSIMLWRWMHHPVYSCDTHSRPAFVVLKFVSC